MFFAVIHFLFIFHAQFDCWLSQAFIIEKDQRLIFLHKLSSDSDDVRMCHTRGATISRAFTLGYSSSSYVIVVIFFIKIIHYNMVVFHFLIHNISQGTLYIERSHIGLKMVSINIFFSNKFWLTSPILSDARWKSNMVTIFLRLQPLKAFRSIICDLEFQIISFCTS